MLCFSSCWNSELELDRFTILSSACVFEPGIAALRVECYIPLPSEASNALEAIVGCNVNVWGCCQPAWMEMMGVIRLVIHCRQMPQP